MTPSFWLQHVVYVDRHELAHQFFTDASEVRALIDGRKHYRTSAHLDFLPHDFTEPLPVRTPGFDLLISLYAPAVSRACASYLAPQGLLLTNNHRGDAEDALADPRLELIGVLLENRNGVTLAESDLEGYLQRKPAAANRYRQSGGQPAYVREADYYLFRRKL